jgi:hypothetical protein
MMLPKRLKVQANLGDLITRKILILIEYDFFIHFSINTLGTVLDIYFQILL